MNTFYKVDSTTGKCIVTGNKIDGEFYYDLEDEERIKEHSWYLVQSSKTKYVFAKINGHKYPLHKFIMNVPIEKGKRSEVEIDHKDRNGLNNRKSNLEIVSVYDNNKNQGKRKDNTTGVTGVTKRRNCYIAEIRDSKLGRKSKSFCIKNYNSEKEAFEAAKQQRMIWAEEYNNKNGI